MNSNGDSGHDVPNTAVDVQGLAEKADRIAELLAGASTELNQLGRLLRVSSQVERPAAAQPPAATAPPRLAPQPVMVPGFPPQPAMAPPAAAAPVAPPAQPSLADRFARWASQEGAGTRLLAWAGGAVTLLGIVLLLAMAIQQGWIGPGVRVTGGAVLGLCLLGCAQWVYQKSPETGRAGAFSLVSTGIATLYLDVLASTALYHFLPTPAGLLFALVLAGCGLWWADRWSAQILAVGVTLGCALTAPLLFGSVLGGTSRTALLTAFLVVLKIAATPVQLRRAWPVLTAAAALPAIISALVVSSQATLNGADRWPAVAAAGVVAVSGIGLAIVTARRRPKDPIAVALLLTSGAPALLVATLLGRWPDFWMVMTIAAAYFAVWRATRHVPPWLRTAAGAACALAVFQATAGTVDGHARSMTLLGEAAILAALSMRLRSKRMLLTAIIYGSVGGLLAIAVDVPPAILTYFPAPPYFDNGTAPYSPNSVAQTSVMVSGEAIFLCLGVVSILLSWAAIRLKLLHGLDIPPLPAGLVPALGALYSGAGLVLTACLLIEPTELGFRTGQALITVSWMTLASILLLRGIRSTPHRAAGFTLVAVALAKLLLFDLAALTGLSRVAAFLGAGLVLLAGGITYARLLTRVRSAASS